MRVAVTGQNRKVKTERKKTIINKLRDSGAFTLAEALVATIILLLVSVIMITGIPAAINAYNNVTVFVFGYYLNHIQYFFWTMGFRSDAKRHANI